MADTTKNSRGIVSVALDIAKKNHDVRIAFPNGKQGSMQIPNTLIGYQALLDKCLPDSHDIRVAFEPTADWTSHSLDDTPSLFYGLPTV